MVLTARRALASIEGEPPELFVGVQLSAWEAAPPQHADRRARPGPRPVPGVLAGPSPPAGRHQRPGRRLDAGAGPALLPAGLTPQGGGARVRPVAVGRCGPRADRELTFPPFFPPSSQCQRGRLSWFDGGSGGGIRGTGRHGGSQRGGNRSECVRHRGDRAGRTSAESGDARTLRRVRGAAGGPRGGPDLDAALAGPGRFTRRPVRQHGSGRPRLRPVCDLGPGARGQWLEPRARSGHRPRRRARALPGPLGDLAQSARSRRRRRHPLARSAPDRHRSRPDARRAAAALRARHRTAPVLRAAHAERASHPSGPFAAPSLGAARAGRARISPSASTSTTPAPPRSIRCAR